MLQQRNHQDTLKWQTYLFYFQSALYKLPNLQIIGYRGMQFNDIIKQNYTLGRKIHWSAYSSTSSILQCAKEFAGKGGIIMQITILCGKNIKNYSILSSEDEIIISPNMTFRVTKLPDWDTHQDFYYIELVQEAPQSTFVF